MEGQADIKVRANPGFPVFALFHCLHCRPVDFLCLVSVSFWEATMPSTAYLIYFCIKLNFHSLSQILNWFIHSNDGSNREKERKGGWIVKIGRT